MLDSTHLVAKPLLLAVLATSLLTADVRADVPAPRQYAVESHRDLMYYEGKDADPVRHQLDVFVPEGTKDFPTVVLVHGGGWIMGNKSFFGLYSSVGRFLARNGIGAVLPNYRLSPAVRHPEHIKDVARAFAWTHRNIARYGGRPDRLFVAGHSAGGHLAALLATDATYLEAEGLKPSAIRGVIPVSGVYRILQADIDLRVHGPEHRTSFTLEGIGSLPAIRFDLLMPGKMPQGEPKRINLSPFTPVFGDDPAVRKAAAPLTHVRPGLPPFLVIYAQYDFPTLGPMAEEFAEALRRSQCDVRLMKADDRSHTTILFRAANDGDPVGKAILEFVAKHSAERS